MCDKTVGKCFFVFVFIPDWYKTPVMCERVVSEDYFLIVYCINKIQRLYDQAIDDCLAALKFIPNWFVKNKMLEKFYIALLANDDILFLMKILIKSHLFLIKDIFLL